MHVNLALIIVWFFFTLIVILSCVVLYRKNNLLRELLKGAQHKNKEVGKFLSLFSQSLKSVDEIKESMNVTARYVADLVEAQSICIFRIEGDVIKAEGISGSFPTLTKSPDYILTKPRYILETLKRQKIRIGEGIIGHIAQNREPLFLEDAVDDPRITALNSVVPIDTLMGVPLIFHGNLLGIICAVNNRSEKTFSTEQFSRLKSISDQVILAHNFVQIYSNLSEQQRINQELQFTRELQASLLPKRFPVWDQFVVHSFTRSAKEVNGDFYDFVEIDENRLLLVVGDASGKGVPACMVMAMTRSFIRANISRFTSLRDLLIELNDNLFRDTEEEHFITLACCLLDKKLSCIEYAKAGHTPLVIYNDSKVRTINPKGSGLGLLPGDLARFDTFSFEFKHNMTILLFTDGLTEALSNKQEEYGLDNLCNVFENACGNESSPDVITNNILQDIDAFSDPMVSQADDQTMVIIKHL